MKSNEITRKKLMAGALSLALMTAFLPQAAFADASQVTMIKTTPIVVSTTSAMASTTKAISIDQLTFKSFISDMKLKSNTPTTTLAQAEKHFNDFKVASKAKQDKKAMASFNKMMQLLAKYQDIKEIKATVIDDTASTTSITAITSAVATTPATPIQ